MIKLTIRVGRGGLVVDEKTEHAKTLEEAGEALARHVRALKNSGCTLMVMHLEFLKDWEV